METGSVSNHERAVITSFYYLQDVRCWLDCHFLLINTWEVDVFAGGPSELVRPA